MAAATTSRDEPVLFGVIGGSGVYQMDGLTDKEERFISTPFGCPSDSITIARMDGVRCAFLPRHGRNHTFNPSEVNYRANIYALKTLGVKYLISVSAVGSLRAHMRPGDLVCVTQVIDRTVHRNNTFYEKGIVAHVPFGTPYCPKLHNIAVRAIREALPDVTVHEHGCTVTMEGPVFSTKAESVHHQQLGGDLIGMTSATEMKLAREAEMAHLVVSMVTDMDAWTDEPHVDVAAVVATLHKNAANAQIYLRAILKAAEAAMPIESEAHSAMGCAIMTKPVAISDVLRRRLAPLIGKYVPADPPAVAQ